MSGQPTADVLPVAAGTNPAERIAGLFDAHYGRLYRLARRLASSADDALDLVQETFLKAARAPASVPYGSVSEEAWLARVLVNIQRDQWRKAAVRTRHAEEMRRSASMATDQEPALLARAMIWRALELLPPRRRAVIVLHELEGMAIPVIASLLGISAVTVRWHLSMGRRELARALGPRIGANK